MPAATGSLMRRLYRGETNFDFIGQRKKWYIASGILVLICLASIVFRGFNFGIGCKFTALGLSKQRGSFPKRETLTMAIGAAGIGCVLLLVGFVANVGGPPPPSVSALVMIAIAGSVLLVAWSWWADRHRDAIRNGR